MSIPPVLAMLGGRAVGHLKRVGGRGLLALLAAAVIMLVSVLGALLPDATLPLTWYVPVLDSAMLVTLAVVLFLSSSDVIIRRHGRLLPLAFVSVVLGMVWLQHMLTFPGVAPFTLPLVTNQTAPFLFQAGHIGTPALFAWILFHRAGPLAQPRRSLSRTLALALGLSIAAVAVTAGLARILPPLIVNGRFTGLNTLLQAVPFLVLAAVAVAYRRARNPERRIETSVIAGLIFVSVETMVFMFMQARYDGFWYVGHGLMLLPCVALLVGTIGLYTAARRDAEVQLRVVEQLKASQQRLQVIIDTSPSAVISADETGLITGWNRKAEEIFGWSHDEALGRTLTGTIIPRRYRDAHQRGLARFIETGEGRLLGETVELAGLHRDGHEFPVEVSVTATSRSASRVEFVAFINDVSQRRMAERLRGVQFAVTRPLASAATWAEAAPQVLRGICESLGWAAGEFWRVDKDANALRWECGWHRPSKDFGAILDNVADGIITIDERLVVRSYNPAAERLFGHGADEVIGKDFARLIAEPYRPEVKPRLRAYLRAQQGLFKMGSHETVGLRKDGTTFPMEFNVGWLGPQRLVVGSLRDVSERKAETEALQFQALHDALTGLPNRTFLRERLEETIRAGEREMKPCALLLMDLDGFKSVNDTLGHETGDRLLEQVSERMRGVLRKADTISRYGGDEFAVVPWGATDVPRAVLIAEKIVEAVGKPITIDDQPITVNMSIGIAVFPQHADDADALTRRADVAMYAAKRARSGFSVYSVDQEGGDNGGRVPLIGKLRYAIDQFELVLHYQPIISVPDGRPTKVEALVRWGHPSHGLLPPDDFIPSAEQTDLIKPLTAWVLNEALGQVHAWSRAGIDIGVAVNLSARNLLDDELPDAVAQLLSTWQVAPEKLSLEITERSIIATEAEATLQRLHGMGVRISVDDFGTGYSSLTYLKRLPVHEIKIDKSFVLDMATNGDGAAIVRSTIDLGHTLGLTVVAEGVEDEKTAQLLRDYGCDFIQGFHISRPAAPGPLGPCLRTRAGLNGALSA